MSHFISYSGENQSYPNECAQIGTDITQIEDITEEEAEKVIENINMQNIQILMNMHEEAFDDAAANIRRAQKRQKKNYDIRHGERAQFFQIGDIVMKREMANKNRKGGKLDSIVEDTVCYREFPWKWEHSSLQHVFQ